MAPDDADVGAARDTTYAGRQYVGAGRLDTERQAASARSTPQTDDIGILSDRPDGLVDGTTGADPGRVPLCQTHPRQQVPIFPWGDLSGRCTRGNGVLDTEDLNGDNGLNSGGANENVFRYVVSLQPGGKYFVRTGRDGATWQLYRVPIRTPDATIGTPEPAPDPASPHGRSWRRRTPATPDVVGQLRPGAAAVRGLALGAALRAPDRRAVGLREQADRRGDRLGRLDREQRRPGLRAAARRHRRASRRAATRSSIGVQINEKSLRIIGRELDVGDRAEAYLRFPAGPQNALGVPDPAGLGPRPRGRLGGGRAGGVREAGQRRPQLLPVSARGRTPPCGRRSSRSTSRPGGGSGPRSSSRWLSGEPPSGAADLRHAGPERVRRLRRPLPRPRRRPRHQPAQPRRDAGDLGGPLPRRAAPARCRRRSSGSTTSGSRRRCPSWARRWRWTRGWPPPTSARSTSRTPARTGSSARSTPTRRYRTDRHAAARQQLAARPVPPGVARPRRSRLTPRYVRTGVDPELLTGTDLRGDGADRPPPAAVPRSRPTASRSAERSGARAGSRAG